MIFDSGATNQSLDVMVVDDMGLAVTGLVAATFPPLKYSLAGPHDDVAFPALSDLPSMSTSYLAGGVIERGEGVYRLDAPDDMFVSSGRVRLRGDVSGKHLIVETIDVAPPVNTTRLSGTLQSARDIGASVLIAEGTGTGELSLSAGAVLLQAEQSGVTIANVTTVGSVSGNVDGNVAGTVGSVTAAVTITDSADISAIKARTDNLPVSPAATGDQMDLVSSPNPSAIDALVTSLFDGGSIDGYNLQQALRLIAAAVIGKVAGLPGTSVTQRAIDDSKTRLTLTLDTNGNITDVTVDAT